MVRVMGRGGERGGQVSSRQGEGGGEQGATGGKQGVEGDTPGGRRVLCTIESDHCNFAVESTGSKIASRLYCRFTALQVMYIFTALFNVYVSQ